MKLLIIGAGGHGKVVYDIATQIAKYEKINFLDDNSNDDRVIGKCSDYLNFKEQDTEMYPAFGNNEMRVNWENKLVEEGIALASIIHPLAYISPLARVEAGTVVMPYAIINTGVIIKKACIVNLGAIVDHDCIIEPGCHLAPGAVVKGENHLPSCTKVDSGEIVCLKYYK